MTPRQEAPTYDRRRWLLKLVGASDLPSPSSQESGPDSATAPVSTASPALPSGELPMARPRPRNRAPAALPSVRIDADSGDPDD